MPSPNLNPNQLVMILKFQTYEVFFPLASDIEKAYLMIEIAKEVGKYLKKFLFNNGDSESFDVMNIW